MAVQNGQLANQTTFNSRLMSRTTDTNTLGRVDLENALAESGANVINVQKNINALASALGIPTNQVFNYLITWASDIVGAPNDSVRERVQALVALFDGVSGHNHSGVDGQGPPISAANLTEFNRFSAVWQGFSETAPAANSMDVSTSFAGKSPGGDTTTVGVITDPPSNRVQLFNPANGTPLENDQGLRIYGRLTESAGVWTLFFFTFDGTENAHTFDTTQDFDAFYLEVFDQQNRPTIPASPDFGSLNVSADVPDATTSIRGLVNTIAQSFAGFKTFENGLRTLGKFQGQTFVDTTTNVPSATLLNVDALVYEFTGSNIVDLVGIQAAGSDSDKIQIIVNKTGGPVNVVHDAGALGFIIPGGDDFELDDQAAMMVRRDNALNRWQVIAGGGAGGDTTVGYYETPAGAINGSNTTFGPLSFVPATNESVIVYVDGVALRPDEFSLVGLNVVLTTPPVLGQTVDVFYLTGGVLAPPPIPTGVFKVEYRTLTNAEIAAKSLTLAHSPVAPTEICVDVAGGTIGFYGDDFNASGSTISWTGLGFDGLLAVGDKLRISYVY
jgi:hypothetical protein